MIEVPAWLWGNFESEITAGSVIPHNSKYGGVHETGLLSIQSINQETGG